MPYDSIEIKLIFLLVIYRTCLWEYKCWTCRKNKAINGYSLFPEHIVHSPKKNYEPAQGFPLLLQATLNWQDCAIFFSVCMNKYTSFIFLNISDKEVQRFYLSLKDYTAVLKQTIINQLLTTHQKLAHFLPTKKPPQNRGGKLNCVPIVSQNPHWSKDSPIRTELHYIILSFYQIGFKNFCLFAILLNRKRTWWYHLSKYINNTPCKAICYIQSIFRLNFLIHKFRFIFRKFVTLFLKF